MVLGVIFVAFHNPIDALTGNGKYKKTHATATATATPIHQSFSGVSGGAVVTDRAEEEKKDSLVCITNYMTSKGNVYVVLPNGRTRLMRKGEKYEECR